MQVLLTGFGPFGDVVDNPTERLARAFDGRRLTVEWLGGDGPTSRELEVHGLALPTSFARAKELVLAREGYDAIVMLGVAETATELCVEIRGTNRDEARIEDVDGATPRDVIARGVADTLATTLDPELVRAALAETGAPVRLSTSAGAYVCNHTLFEVLRRGRTPTTFVHVPPDRATTRRPRENAVDHTMLARAIEGLLRALPRVLSGRLRDR